MEVGKLGFEREMQGTVSGNVARSSGARTITVESATKIESRGSVIRMTFRNQEVKAQKVDSFQRKRRRIKFQVHDKQDNDSLHGLKDSRVASHTEVIVRAPNVDFVGRSRSMSNRELCSQSIDIIEISIALVLMLLIEFSMVERAIVEASVSVLLFVGGITEPSFGFDGSRSRSVAERAYARTSTGERRMRSRRGWVALSVSEGSSCFAGGRRSSRAICPMSNRADTWSARACTGGAFIRRLLMNSLKLGVSSERGETLDMSSGANTRMMDAERDVYTKFFVALDDEGGSHDGAFCRFISETRDGWVARGCRGCKCSEGRGLCVG